MCTPIYLFFLFQKVEKGIEHKLTGLKLYLSSLMSFVVSLLQSECFTSLQSPTSLFLSLKSWQPKKPPTYLHQIQKQRDKEKRVCCCLSYMYFYLRFQHYLFLFLQIKKRKENAAPSFGRRKIWSASLVTLNTLISL